MEVDKSVGIRVGSLVIGKVGFVVGSGREFGRFVGERFGGAVGMRLVDKGDRFVVGKSVGGLVIMKVGFVVGFRVGRIGVGL